MRRAQPIALHRQHFHQLPTPPDQRLQRNRLFRLDRSRLGLQRLRKAHQGLCIQPIGLRQKPRRPGKVTHVTRIDDPQRHPCRTQLHREGPLKPARRFHQHERRPLDTAIVPHELLVPRLVIRHLESSHRRSKRHPGVPWRHLHRCTAQPFPCPCLVELRARSHDRPSQLSGLWKPTRMAIPL